MSRQWDNRAGAVSPGALTHCLPSEDSLYRVATGQVVSATGPAAKPKKTTLESLLCLIAHFPDPASLQFWPLLFQSSRWGDALVDRLYVFPGL